MRFIAFIGLFALLMILIFSDVSEAKDILLPAQTESGIGFVNQKGQMVIKPKYEETHGFYQRVTKDDANLAAVMADKKWGVIDRKGAYIVKPKYDGMYVLEDGMIVVNLRGKWGAINEKGTIVIPTIYDRISNFSDGYASVTINGREGWAYVSKLGKLITPKETPQITKSQVRLSVLIEGKYGYMDENGFIAIAPQFDRAFWFYKNVAVVTLNGKTGVIDRNGKFLVQPIYRNAGFVNGHDVIVAHRPGRYDLFAPNGNLIITTNYNSLELGLSPGALIAAELDGKWGYIDYTGVVKIPFRYTGAWGFEEGYASVDVDGKRGVIDESGKSVIPIQFASMPERTAANTFIVKPDSSRHEGLMDLNGHYIRPPIYSSINEVYPGIVECKIGEMNAYFAANGDVIWNPKNLP